MGNGYGNGNDHNFPPDHDPDDDLDRVGGTYDKTQKYSGEVTKIKDNVDILYRQRCSLYTDIEDLLDRKKNAPTKNEAVHQAKISVLEKGFACINDPSDDNIHAYKNAKELLVNLEKSTLKSRLKGVFEGGEVKELTKRIDKQVDTLALGKSMPEGSIGRCTVERYQNAINNEDAKPSRPRESSKNKNK